MTENKEDDDERVRGSTAASRVWSLHAVHSKDSQMYWEAATGLPEGAQVCRAHCAETEMRTDHY